MSGHWSEVRRLFHNMVDLPTAEQRAALREANAPAEIAAAVERLLDAERASSPLLERTPTSAGQLRPAGEGPSLAEGALLAERFEIRRPLGVGGMGEVYAAWDRELEEETALKILRPGLEPGRLLKEVLAARRVTHRNVCRIFDIGRHERLAFFTMELLPGVTLAERLREGPLSGGTMHGLFTQLTAALVAAHEAGVLHRDVKPANVMCVAPQRFVMMDFGLARRLRNSRYTATGPLTGTLGYMAPEVVAGRAHTAAADVYSLGVLMHQAATGRMPFDEAPERAVEPEMRELIEGCLQLDPKRRLGCAAIEERLRQTGVVRVACGRGVTVRHGRSARRR